MPDGPYLDDDYLAAVEREELESTASTPAPERDPSSELPAAVRALDAPPPAPIRWLIEDVWPAGEFGLLVGDGGAFKSSAALHLAAAVAGGYPAFDRYATEQRPVFVLSAEDAEPVVLMRLEAFVAGHGWDRARVLGNVHVLASPDATLHEPRWRLHLKAELERIRPGLLILDPWAELLGGEENSNTEARPMIKYLRRLAAPHDCAIAVVHHAGKAGQDKRTLDRIRGASALPSASRVILFFDYRADGVAVENLKMSRSPRLEPFIIDRQIESDPTNRAMWRTARLTIESERAYIRSRAEMFVLTQLRAVHPKRLHTGALRDMARETPGIRNEELAAAQTRLMAQGLIDWMPGARSSKQWGLTDAGMRWSPSREGSPNDPAQNGWAGSKSPPCPPCPNPARSGSRDDVDPARPLKGAAGRVNRPDPVGRVEHDSADLLAELDERLGMREESLFDEETT